MAKVHELIFKIQGALDKSLGSSVDKANSSLDRMARHLNKLEQQKINVDKYKKLTASVETTRNAFKKATDSMNPLQKEFLESEKATNKLGRELNEAEKRVYELSKEMYNTTNPTKDMRNALSLAKLEVSKLRGEFKASEGQTKALGREFNAAKTDANNLERSLDSQEKELGQLTESLKLAGKGTEFFTNLQNKLEGQLKNTERVMKNYKNVQDSYSKLQDNWSTTKNRAGDFMKTGAAMGAIMAIPLKFTIDAEETMADVNKMVDFESFADMKEFEKKMSQRIGTDLPLKFEEYGELIANAAGAGIGKGMEGQAKYDELLGFGEDSAKMAVAFDIEGGAAGEMMAKWRAAFAMNQNEVVALADKINYLGDNSAAKASQIADMVSEVGALGGVAGMTTGDVAAISTAMVSMGVNSDVGATAIKKMSTSLTKGAAASKNALAFYEKMGMTSSQVAQDMQDDAQGTVLKVLEGISKLDAVEQTSALREIFGEVSIGAVAPLLQNIDQLQDYFGMMDESAKLYGGSMEREFGIRSETTANKLIILRSNMESIASTVGKVLLPKFVELTEKGTELAQKFQQWNADNPGRLDQIVQIALGLGGLVLAGKGLSVVAGLFSTMGSAAGLAFNVVKLGGSVIFPLLTGAVKVAGGIFTKALIPAIKVVWSLFMASPLVIKIMLIVAAVKLLYDNWDKITGFFKDTIEKIKGFFGGLGEKLGGVVEMVKGFGGVIKGLADGVAGFFKGADAEMTTAERRVRGSSLNNYRGTGTGAVDVEGYASGGIITRPELAVVGEGGAHEAIIPLDGTANAMRLWQYAGEKLGMVKSGTSASGTGLGTVGSTSGYTTVTEGRYTIEMPITVNVDGGATGNLARQLEEALMSATPRLKAVLLRLLEEIDTDKRRVAFT